MSTTITTVPVFKAGVVEVGPSDSGTDEPLVYFSIEHGTGVSDGSLVHLTRPQWRAVKKAVKKAFRASELKRCREQSRG